MSQITYFRHVQKIQYRNLKTKTMKTVLFSIRLVIVILFCLLTGKINCQIKIFDNGNVGIKYISSSPLSKLVYNNEGSTSWDIYFSSISRSTSGGCLYAKAPSGQGTSNHIYGFYGQADLGTSNLSYGVRGMSWNATPLTVGRSYGVYGLAGNATNGFNYGVYGYLLGSNNGAAVFGTSSGDYQIPGKYAGYFYGNVHVTGTLNGFPVYTSDEKTKTNISALVAKDGSDRIGSLKPIRFNLKQREVASSDSLRVMNYYDPDSELFKKPKYGFVAQELREIFPDLVYTGEDGLLAIDYVGLIPIIIQTIQEQQKRIDFLEKSIQEIKSGVVSPTIKED